MGGAGYRCVPRSEWGCQGFPYLIVAQPLQRTRQLGAVTEAHLRHFFEATQDNFFQGQRYSGVELAGRSWLVLNMLHSHGYKGITIERRTAGEHFIQDDAECIDISRRADDFALGLLGCVVLHGPQRHPGGSEPLIINVFIDTSDAEVGQLNRAVTTHQHILWFHIAMDDPATMRGTQAKGDVVGTNDGPINVQANPGTHPPTHIPPLYQFLDSIIFATLLS